MEERIELTVPERRKVWLPGCTIHRAVSLEPAEIKRVDGIRVTSVARTVIDLAAVLPKVQLELTLDHVLAIRLASVVQLERRLRFLGRQGRKGAGGLASLLDARPSGRRAPESEIERQLLRVLRLHRLPKPECQYQVRLSQGRRAFLDFAYPAALLAIEADSYRHHSSLGDWARDRARNNELVALGWRILPVTAVDLRTNPESVADQVARALASSRGSDG
jgi:very-short-patch-repair endonuclease